MAEKKVFITQSMMKDFYEYHNGNQCGLIFVEKYINKNYEKFPPSDSQAVGNWFEYKCIGATTKQSKVPQPEKTAKGELTAPYKRMEAQVQNFKNFMSIYGIEIVSVQEKLTIEDVTIILDNDNGEQVPFKIDGLEGTTDVICKAKYDIKGIFEVKDDFGKVVRVEEQVIIYAGEEFILDIKTTGLLDDKWNDYGWDLSNLHNKEKLIRQPIHYKYLTELKYGKQYKFLFLLFSQSNDYDFRSIIFNIDEDQHIKEHKEFIVWTNRWIKYHLKNGFKAVPDVVRCHSCPIKLGCKHFMAVPKIQIYHYQPQKK